MRKTEYTLKYKNPRDWNRAKHMYQLTPAPPQMELNAYIEHYKSTDDFLYIQFFLHCYEYRLNKIVERYCRTYVQLRNFEDIKQTIVAVLIQLLPKYDSTLSVPFVVFAKPYVNAAIHRYIRKYGAYSVENDNHYRELRRVNAIYYSAPERTVNERIAEVIRQTGKSEDDVRKLLIEGENFRYYDSIFVDLEDDSGDSYFEEWVIDEYSQPETLVPGMLLYDDMISRVENLSHCASAILLRAVGYSLLILRQMRKICAERGNCQSF